MRLIGEGKPLLFSIIEHCFAKVELKRSAFLVKSVINMLSWSVGRMQGIYVSFKSF